MSLPFWWVLLTAIYLILLSPFENGDGAVSFLGLFVPILGLFVPIGFYNLAFSGLWVVIIFPLILLTVFGGERLLRKLNLSPIMKFLAILGILFLLTIAVDVIIWGTWRSLALLPGDEYWYPRGN